jgi:hypothetical protein
VLLTVLVVFGLLLALWTLIATTPLVGLMPGLVGAGAAIVLLAPFTHTVRAARLNLWSAMTAEGGFSAAAIGLLGSGTFGLEGVLDDRGRFPLENSFHSWVGLKANTGALEIWAIERDPGSRPLSSHGTPRRVLTLDGGLIQGVDLRVDGDRAYPRLWLRWRIDGELHCAEFLPFREQSLFRIPLPAKRFEQLADDLGKVVSGR